MWEDKIVFKSSESIEKGSLAKHLLGKSISLKDLEDGAILEPVEIVVYKSADAEGKDQVIVSMLCADGKYYGSSSKTFCEQIGKIYEIMKPDPFQIAIVKKTGKTGRTYISCELV